MPRSPTRTSSPSPNRSRTTCDGLDEGGRVGGVAGEHPHRDRAPGRVGEQPVLDLQFALLAVAGVAARGQRAVRALHPRRGQVEQRHPVGVDRRGQVPGGQRGLDRVLAGQQPVHRRVHLIGATPPATPRSTPSVVSAHQDSVASFDAGASTRDTINARARSRDRPAGPSSAGQPQRRACATPRRRARAAATGSPSAAASAGTSRSPRSAGLDPARSTSAGSADRLATVSLRTLPPSR